MYAAYFYFLLRYLLANVLSESGSEVSRHFPVLCTPCGVLPIAMSIPGEARESSLQRLPCHFPSLLISGFSLCALGRSIPHLRHTPEERVQTSTSPKGTFAGVVSIDLKRFQDSGVRLFECPNCARTRTLSPRKGVLRFPSHEKRKINTPVTSQRWAMSETIWDVVGG